MDSSMRTKIWILFTPNLQLAFVNFKSGTLNADLIKFPGFFLGQSMWEDDQTPVESGQTALSFFRERSSVEELEKDRHVKSILKQLEEKESSWKQALLKLDHYQKTSEELSTLLKNSDSKKEFYINECQEAKVRANELESRIEEMANQLSEYEMTRKQLSDVASELMSTQGQLLNKKAEIAELKRAKVESIVQFEAMESTLSQEKLKMEELLRHMSELNETVTQLRLKVLEVEKEKAEELSEKEAELGIAAKKVAEAQNQVEIMHDLEKQLQEKSASVDSLLLELKQANDLLIFSEKAASDAILELAQLQADMELQRRKNLDQAAYISLIDTELEKLKIELRKSEQENWHLNSNAENLKTEVEKVRAEMVEIREEDREIRSEAAEIREKRNEAQVETAFLKSELQNERLKLAAAEVSEAKSKSETSALENTIQQLVLELEEAKKENEELKKAIELAGESKSNNIVEPPEECCTQSAELVNTNEGHKISEERKDRTDVHETSVRKNVSLHENVQQFEGLKKELEIALSKIGDYRMRAEQAISRAEAAEKAKAALEEGIKRLQERKERRKTAISALREESSSEVISTTDVFKQDDAVKRDRSLGKVLNIKL